MQPEASDAYISGQYWENHPEWLTDHRPLKAKDIVAGLLAVIDDSGLKQLKVADVGGGTGGTLVELLRLTKEFRPAVTVVPTVFDIASNAIARGKELYPNIEFRREFFDIKSGYFDVILLIDVLEHLENPWELLRVTNAAAPYLIVRQPLLTSLGTFWRNAYAQQRVGEGHIAHFDYYKFIDMAETCGWNALAIELLAVWELPFNQDQKPSLIKKLLFALNRPLASVLISGSYLTGAFKRSTQSQTAMTL
jgi:SAM-dependent methyltransferase